MRFIDAHVHFWDRDRMPYTWLHEVPSLWPRHTPATLPEEAGVDRPEKIVVVECGAPPFDEAQWVGELAQRFTAHLDPDAQSAIFHGNATRVYRI